LRLAPGLRALKHTAYAFTPSPARPSLRWLVMQQTTLDGDTATASVSFAAGVDRRYQRYATYRTKLRPAGREGATMVRRATTLARIAPLIIARRPRCDNHKAGNSEVAQPTSGLPTLKSLVRPPVWQL